jgi:NAD(P)-dependent dehydrogenase (short-subunit alcohol dehydrogenase family)
MLKQNSQCYVINTASMVGLITPTIGTGIYGMTKHAIIALSEVLKLELARIGAKINVLALCPGFAFTNLTESDRNRPKELYHGTTANPELKQIMKAYQQSIENGISPKDVAEILFQALKGEKFYIPTDHHRYLRRGVKNRMESIIQDLQK